MLSTLKHFIFQKTDTVIGIAIFVTCLFIYLATDQIIASTDDIPNTLLAFNWLTNHELNFDSFRNTYDIANAHFFREANNGHVSSKYPIGAAVISFPLYLIFFIKLNLGNLFTALTSGLPLSLVDVTAHEFNAQRLQFETLAATILTSLSVVIFYYLSRLNFGRSICFISTFIFAFCTSTWVVNSQSLRQHSMSNLVTVTVLLCLFKANRVDGKRQIFLLLLGGFFSGLLFSIRPTNLAFCLLIFIFTLFAYRLKKAFIFLLGHFSVLPAIIWNIYYFGIDNFLKGGYVGTPGDVRRGSQYFFEAFIGLMLSPNRGWLIFSPILLFSVIGFFQVLRQRKQQDEQLILFTVFSCTMLYFYYCFYAGWPGVLVYGPSRFLLEIIPTTCYLLNYAIAHLLHQYFVDNKFVRFLVLPLLITCIFFSNYTQVIGVFGNSQAWTHPIPYSNQLRTWDMKDNQIARVSRSLFFKIRPPIKDSQEYQKSIKANIIELYQLTDRSAPSELINDGIYASRRQKKYLQVKLENSGESTLYGYKTGMKKDILFAQVSFVDQSSGEIAPFSCGKKCNRLFLSRITEPGEIGDMIGLTRFPRKPGTYDMVLQFALRGRHNFTMSENNESYSVPVIVR